MIAPNGVPAPLKINVFLNSNEFAIPLIFHPHFFLNVVCSVNNMQGTFQRVVKMQPEML